MTEMYKIGQVLYIISPKTQAVIPVQIQEINRRTTIEGEEIQFLVMDPDGRGPHNLDDINGQIFTNSSDVAKVLKENANKAIEGMVAKAISVAKEKFGSGGGADDLFPPSKKIKAPPPPPVASQPKKADKNVEEDFDEVEVVGPDGKTRVQKQKIRIHMPENLQAAL